MPPILPHSTSFLLRPLSHSLSIPTLNTTREKSAWVVPEGAWDAHMHVTDLRKYPPTIKGQYSPHNGFLPQARRAIGQLGIENLAFVQPSYYGVNHVQDDCLMDALRTMGPRQSRGVIVYDIRTISSHRNKAFRAMHALGVRGVRLNLKSSGTRLGKAELQTLLEEMNQHINPQRTWAIHIYTDLATMKDLVDIVPTLSCNVCVDHFGGPPRGIDHNTQGLGSGWTALKQLLNQNENFFVKLSAPYRFTNDPEFRTMERWVSELLGCRNGEGVVFASDWPHTRFEGTSANPWVERCLDWCGYDSEVRGRLFRFNAEKLLDAGRGDGGGGRTERRVGSNNYYKTRGRERDVKGQKGPVPGSVTWKEGGDSFFSSNKR